MLVNHGRSAQFFKSAKMHSHHELKLLGYVAMDKPCNLSGLVSGLCKSVMPSSVVAR